MLGISHHHHYAAAFSAAGRRARSHADEGAIDYLSAHAAQQRAHAAAHGLACAVAAAEKLRRLISVTSCFSKHAD